MRKTIALICGAVFCGAIAVYAATWPGSSGAGGFTGGTVSGSTTFLSTLTVNGASLIQSTQPVLTITVNDAVGTGQSLLVNQSSASIPGGGFSVGVATFVVKAGQIGVGTTSPSASSMVNIVQNGWQPGVLQGLPIFIKSTGAQLNTTDVQAGIYLLFIDTGTTDVENAVGHEPVLVVRSSDTVNGHGNTFSIEGRGDSFGEGTKSGFIALVHGNHVGITTNTIRGLGIDLQQNLMDDSTALSSGTIVGIDVINWQGGASTSTFLLRNTKTRSPIYTLGNIQLGQFASSGGTTNTDSITISDNLIARIAMTSTNGGQTIGSQLWNVGGSSTTVLWTTTNHPLELGSVSTVGMTISTTSQNVGIGTKVPATSLDVSTGTVGLPSFTSLALAGVTAGKIGGLVYNTTINMVCMSTNTAVVNGFARIQTPATGCQ